MHIFIIPAEFFIKVFDFFKSFDKGFDLIIKHLFFPYI